MNSLTKYDVLVYLSNGNVEIGELIRQLKQNAIFKARERKIRLLLAELRKDGFISKNKPVIALTSKATDTLAFLLWLKKDGIDYNIPFKKGYGRLFQKIFEKGETYLVDKSMFSKPTTLKIARDMKSINFIKALKRKPLTVKARVIDRTTLFANIFGYNFSAFQKNIKHTRIEKDSPKLREHLIRLHVYSTTVTEGNTATEKDVERVLQNLGTNLSPREVMEITNAKHAVDELYRTYKSEDLSVELIKKLHKLVMANLAEKPGEFAYVRKRIIGSPVKLPDSKIEIDTAVNATINFYENYRNKMNPLALASLVHFLFVSVHPFIDCNGRVARLLHSFVLLKAGMPLFAFDPNYRNIYFDLLDKGRAEGVEEFVQFCIDKHKELIERL